MIRFEKPDDPNYRFLISNYDRRVRIAAAKGEGVFSRNAIVFVPNGPMTIRLLAEPRK